MFIADRSKELLIWGNDSQVGAAKRMLQDRVIRYRDQQLAESDRLLSQTRQTTAQRPSRYSRHSLGTGRKPVEWDKISPYDSVEKMKRKREKMALEMLRKEPEGAECNV